MLYCVQYIKKYYDVRKHEVIVALYQQETTLISDPKSQVGIFRHGVPVIGQISFLLHNVAIFDV